MSKIKLNKSDIFKMVNECIRQLIKENQFDELVGYHGTVHDFDRFDLSRSGKSQGVCCLHREHLKTAWKENRII